MAPRVLLFTARAVNEGGFPPPSLRPGPANTQLAMRPGGLETRVERLASVLTDLKTQSIVSSSPADHEIEREIEAEKLKARKKISRREVYLTYLLISRRRRAARVLLAEI